MRSLSEAPSIVSTENGGRLSTAAEENFRPELFGQIARLVWPEKADVEIAIIAHCSPRAARDYLSGKVPAPANVWAAIFAEGTRRRRS